MPGDTAALNDLADGEFAERLHGWLQAHCPPSIRVPVLLRLRGAQERQWLRTLYEHGLRAPGIAREYGGMGLSLRKQLIYRKVFDTHGVARVLDIGATLLAPVLLRYGTQEQKQRLIPRILRCDDMWCQGYSEPGAGSDLASLRTTAERRGDVFIVNGQKIWTSHASTASHIFALVRTRKNGRKQVGISFLLMDLATPGITVRPIVNLAGDDEFCEVFFDNVEVPVGQLVGELDAGWTVAKSLLGVERLVTGSPTLASQTFDYLRTMLDTPDVRQFALQDERLARLVCDLSDTKLLYEEVCSAAVEGRALDAEYSVIKVLSTELFQRVADLALELAQERGAVRGESVFEMVRLDLYRLSMIARPGTIYGGTSEVQRDILARLLLGRAGA
jgi:alkylation response protein AidB-like acyl-CoA dehydrogenase